VKSDGEWRKKMMKKKCKENKRREITSPSHTTTMPQAKSK
jgi:hypothetical protein